MSTASVHAASAPGPSHSSQNSLRTNVSSMQSDASPVDKGWAWVVCFAGCFLHIFFVGCIRSTGILLAKVSDYFDRSKRDTSWIMSFMFIIFLNFTPVTMTLAKRYSVRLITLLGSLCLCISFSVSYFATSLEFLYVTIGLFVGLGLSMMHPPTLLLVNMYFNKYRTVATGITLAGCSIGALCMPGLITFLIEEFTFRGSMLVWGGVMLHAIAASLLFRPFRAPSATSGDAEKTDGAAKAMLGDCDAEEDCERFSKSADNVHSDSVHKVDVRQRASTVFASDKSKDNLARGRTMKQSDTTVTMLASCGDIRILSHSRVASLAPTDVAESQPNSHSLLHHLKQLLQFRMLRSPRFWAICIALGIADGGIRFNFFVLPQHGKNLGLTPTEYTRLLQYQGISEVIATVGSGFLADRQIIRRQLLLWFLTLGQAGLWMSLLAMPSYPGLLTFALVEGCLAGGLAALIAPCLVDAFGISKLPISYGLVGISQSFNMLAVPVLLGDLFDKTGSWNAAIAVVGGLISVAGLLLLLDDIVLYRFGSEDDEESQADPK